MTLEEAKKKLDEALDEIGAAGFSVRPICDDIEIHQLLNADYESTKRVTVYPRNYWPHGAKGELVKAMDDERVHPLWRRDELGDPI